MDVCRRLFQLFLLGLFGFSLAHCGSRSSSRDAANKALADNCQKTQINGEKIIRWKSGKVSRHRVGDVAISSASLKKNSDQIAFVEDNFRIQRPKVETVEQKGWGTNSLWGPEAIGAPALWAKNIYGEGVVVAVIDSGIDRQHPQLINQLYVNPQEIANGIDDDHNGLVDDINGYDFAGGTGNLQDTTGHGTHVAGIIAADHDSGPVQGVAPKAKIVMYDFFGSDGGGDVYDAILAIQYAAKSGAKVINASWGGPGCSRTLKETIDGLSAKDILFITAAGNESQNIDQVPLYPAAFESAVQITVGAMTSDGYTAGFSNYGQHVDLVAPGAYILSTYPGADLKIENGTSMATPFVTGAVALLRSAFPQATALQIRRALVSSTRSGPYPVLTRGSLDVAAAYDKLAAELPAALR